MIIHKRSLIYSICVLSMWVALSSRKPQDLWSEELDLNHDSATYSPCRVSSEQPGLL